MKMKCDDLNEVLVDFVDGRLDPADTAGCRAAPGGLRSLRGARDRPAHIRAAAFMLDRHEPPAAIWTALQAKVAAEPAPKGRC